MTKAWALYMYNVIILVSLIAASSACSPESPPYREAPDQSFDRGDASSTDGGSAVGDSIIAPDTLPASCEAGKHYGYIPCVDEIENSAVAQRSQICNRDGTGFDIGDCLLESCAVGFPGDNVCIPQFAGKFVHGLVPVDGYKSTNGAWIALRPKLLDGERLSGTVTITEIGNEYLQPPVPWRLLVDGVPQVSTTIDTTEWPDGTHVLSCQVIDPLGHDRRSGSRVVVLNNSGSPITSLEDHAVVASQYASAKPHSSLAWGRVRVGAPRAYPLDPQLGQHPVATTDADRVRLATEKIWWVEGLNHVPTPLWKPLPVLMKNRDGDYFVKQYNPQGGGSGAKAKEALPHVQRAPAYDGPRGVGWLSPYTTLIPDRYKVLDSGQTGWIGVSKAGRVVRVDIDGRVKTILGPHSVSGVVGTDNADSTIGMVERLARGEKEYVGDDNGLALELSHDIWVCDSFPFEGVIADMGNDRVVEIHFDEQRLMRSWPITDVTSVWGSFETQQELHIAWFAANPEGLWRHVINADENGKPTGHGVIEKVADIPDAFWVRLIGMRVFVMDLYRAIYEYNPVTHAVTEIRPRDVENHSFVFMAIDEFGSIGPKHRLYWSSSKDKTSIHWIDTTDWTTGYFGYHNQARLLANKAIYGSWTALTDPFGHYMWGFAPHTTLPKAISAGITSSSWFLWSACLGPQPAPDPKVTYDGTDEWRWGVRDSYLPPGAVWGFHGHGQIGYSADQFRDYKTWTDARQPILDALESFFWPELTAQDRDNVAEMLFMQRTRKRFQ